MHGCASRGRLARPAHERKSFFNQRSCEKDAGSCPRKPRDESRSSSTFPCHVWVRSNHAYAILVCRLLHSSDEAVRSC